MSEIDCYQIPNPLHNLWNILYVVLRTSVRPLDQSFLVISVVRENKRNRDFKEVFVIVLIHESVIIKSVRISALQSSSHIQRIDPWPPFHLHGITLLPAWIGMYIHYKVWVEITYPFPNSNGATVEVWEWTSHFIPHFTRCAITYPCWD